MTHSAVDPWIKCTSNPNRTFTNKKKFWCFRTFSSFTDFRPVTVQIFPLFFTLSDITVFLPFKQTVIKLQKYTESWGWQHTIWHYLWGWFTDMYTSLRQRNTGKLTPTESNHRCLGFEYTAIHEHMTAEAQWHECSRSDFFFFFLFT